MESKEVQQRPGLIPNVGSQGQVVSLDLMPRLFRARLSERPFPLRTPKKSTPEYLYCNNQQQILPALFHSQVTMTKRTKSE